MMQNLAGVIGCDIFILEELHEARIPSTGLRGAGEVPYRFIGRLGEFTFERAWYYWVARGDVPLAMTEDMYANPIGKKDVRVAGHCGCPPPKEWARNGVVSVYHIDSQEGLNLFVEKLWEYKLV